MGLEPWRVLPERDVIGQRLKQRRPAVIGCCSASFYTFT